MGFDAGDENLYRYVQNSPTNAIDPSGLKVVTIVTDRTGDGDGFWEGLQHGGLFGARPVYTDVSGLKQLEEIMDGFADGSIDELVISGHGTGACGVKASEGVISAESLKDNPAIAAKIAKKLSRGATVKIFGCCAAQNKPSQQLMANLLQAEVEATAGICHPTGLFGEKSDKEWIKISPDNENNDVLRARADAVSAKKKVKESK